MFQWVKQVGSAVVYPRRSIDVTALCAANRGGRVAALPNRRPATKVLVKSPSLSSAVADVVESFVRCVDEHAARPAIVHNGQTTTYGELGARVQSTARLLGAEAGVIGVLTARDPGTVVALLGTLTAGAVYCPIDPAFPEPRQRSMLEAAGATRVLAARAGIPAPAGYPTLVVPDIGADPLRRAIASPTAAADPAAAESPAYVLFTSGSTGIPKGVVTPRRAIGTTVAALREVFELEPDDRVLQFASLNWDTCLEEILPAVTSGATLVIDDEAYTGSFRRFLRAVEARGVTVLDLPTAFWHELVHHLVDDAAGLPPSVRLVIIGGEAVNRDRLADWTRRDTGLVRLLNTYGCTETTLITHAIDLAGPRARPVGDRVPIGVALPHVRERIDEAGELLVGGPAIALGYRDAGATAERFVVHGGERFFRTGDRVERGADGALVLLGRLDRQLKIRGVRVDLAEVEAHISAHAGVAAVAAVGAEVGDHTALVAYVVPRPRCDPATLPGELLAQLRERVPGHLVPSRVTVVPRLLYTPSGKVDRMSSHQHFAQEAC
jgi:amino acid adenylation domain-containing protein